MRSDQKLGRIAGAALANLGRLDPADHARLNLYEGTEAARMEWKLRALAAEHKLVNLVSHIRDEVRRQRSLLK